MLDLRRLAVLQAVAREGSLAAAASALDYTQPAIGHHIRRLEAELDTPLVVREGRSVRLTPAATMLATRAEELFALTAVAGTWSTSAPRPASRSGEARRPVRNAFANLLA